jgi:hypothetical protein
MSVYEFVTCRNKPEGPDWSGFLLAHNSVQFFFAYVATAPNGALAYLHETLRFTSVFLILDRR